MSPNAAGRRCSSLPRAVSDGPGEVRAPSVKLVELPATSRDPAVHPAPFLPTQLREESGPVTEYCLYLWFILLWKMKKS